METLSILVDTPKEAEEIFQECQLRPLKQQSALAERRHLKLALVSQNAT